MYDNPNITNCEWPKRNAVQCQTCEIWKFGSDRREIFIAFAQSGSANSPHPQRDMVLFIPKNYRFIYDFVSILFYRLFQCVLSSEYSAFLSYLLQASV
jgi:hypothetical protein